MARVVLMCGPAGSGKSFVARGLERRGLTRLSFDDLAHERGVASMPVPDDVADGLEAELNAQLMDLVGDGTDVVVDRALWSRRARDGYRALLAPLDADVEVVFVETPRDIALARVAARAGTGGEYWLSPELAAAYYDDFEIPTPDEGSLTIVPGLPTRSPLPRS